VHRQLLSKMKILIVLFLFLTTVFAQTTIISGPSTATSSGNGTPWNSPTNIEVNTTNNPAQVNLFKGTNSQTLTATNFGFSIPSNAVINNVTATFFRQGSTYFSDNYVILIIGGNADFSTNQAGVTWSGNYEAAVYSGWNEPISFFTPDIINNASFGVAFSVSRGSIGGGGSLSANVYFVQMAVTYEIPQSSQQQTTNQLQTTNLVFTTVFGQESTTEQPISATNAQSNNKRAGQIAGIVIGVIFGSIFLVGIIVAIVYLLHKYIKNRPPRQRKTDSSTSSRSVIMSPQEKELFRQMSEVSITQTNTEN